MEKATLRRTRVRDTERNNKKRVGGGETKVSKSNLAICDPISTATLCVRSEQFVGFGTERLFSPC